MKDLALLVADKNIKAALEGLLQRPQALGIRPVSFDPFTHPRCDPGCFQEGAAFLAPRRNHYERGLLVFDRSWSGAPGHDAGAMQALVEQRFVANGLADWAAVVVVDPELEAWVFSDSPQVERALGWTGRSPNLWEWLRARKLLQPGQVKPEDPKAAVEALLREVRRPRSSAIYRDLASQVSVERCVDPSFTRLRGLLRSWFPPESAA